VPKAEGSFYEIATPPLLPWLRGGAEGGGAFYEIATPPLLPWLRGGAEGGGVFLRN